MGIPGPVTLEGTILSMIDGLECQRLWLSGLFRVQVTLVSMFAARVQPGYALAASSLSQYPTLYPSAHYALRLYKAARDRSVRIAKLNVIVRQTLNVM